MAKKTKRGQSELAPPNSLAPIVLAGQRPEDILLPTLHIFHDVGNEAKDVLGSMA